MTGCLVSPVLKDGGTAGGPPVGPHPSRCPTSQQGDPHPTGFDTPTPAPHTALPHTQRRESSRTRHKGGKGPNCSLTILILPTATTDQNCTQ